MKCRPGAMPGGIISNSSTPVHTPSGIRPIDGSPFSSGSEPPLETLVPAHDLATPFALSGSLRELKSERATGVLHCSGTSALTLIYLLEGRPVFAEGGHYPDDFGAVLHEEGLLSQAQVMELLGALPPGLERGLSLAMSRAAIERGFLTPHDVREGLRKQAAQKILECFRSDALTLEFETCEDLPRGIPRLELAFAKLLARGLREIDDPRIIAQILEPLGHDHFVLQRPVDDIVARLDLGHEDKDRLRQIALHRRVSDLVDADDEMPAFLAALLALEEALPAGTPRPEVIPSAPESPRTQTRPKISSHPSAEPPPARTGSTAPADGHAALGRAQRHLAEGCFEDALHELEAVPVGDPAFADVELCLEWTRYRGGSTRNDAGTRRRLRKLALERIRRRGVDGFTGYVLGHLQLTPEEERLAWGLLAPASTSQRDH